MDELELQLQNNIIMYARPTYPYLKELNTLNELWCDDTDFAIGNSHLWILDALNLKKYFERELLEIRWRRYLVKCDIALNYLGDLGK